MSKRVLNEPRASDAASCSVSTLFCSELSITVIYDCFEEDEMDRFDSQIH